MTDIADQLNVREKDVLEMETRMTGQEMTLEPQGEDENGPGFGPAAWLAAPNSEPTEIIEGQQRDWLHTEGLSNALARLDDRSRNIVESRWLRDEDEGGARRGAGARQEGQDLAAGRLVEGPRGLIREDHRRIGGQRAADRDALGLAARELAGAVGAGTVEAEVRQDLACASDRLRFRRSREHKGHCDVLFRRQLGQKLAVLEHEAEAAQAQVGEHALRHGRHLFAVQGDGP